MTARIMTRGSTPARAALVALVIMSGVTVGAILGSLTVAAAHWAFASEPVVATIDR